MTAQNVRDYYEGYRGKFDAGEPPDVVIIDMMADLLHLAEAEGIFEEEDSLADYDPETLFATALMHYEAEKEEADE